LCALGFLQQELMSRVSSSTARSSRAECRFSLPEKDDFADFGCTTLACINAAKQSEDDLMSLTNNRVNWDQVNKWLGRTGLHMAWQPYGLPDIMDPYHSRFSDLEPMPR
jgi:hypothetical protein